MTIKTVDNINASTFRNSLSNPLGQTNAVKFRKFQRALDVVRALERRPLPVGTFVKGLTLRCVFGLWQKT
jgi:hypothetical protein